LQQIKATRQAAAYSSVNMFFMDESRFGLLTIQRRVLTVRGIKPLLPYQHRFENFYLFGAYSPINGEQFTLELPTCNTENFQLYINELAKLKVDELKILFLDNGAFHHSKVLSIPDNIVLLFLPPYSPELNPAEKIWRHLKDAIANKLCNTLDELSDKLQILILQTLIPPTIISISAYDYYITAFKPYFNIQMVLACSLAQSDFHLKSKYLLMHRHVAAWFL
jgi:transposase